MKKLNRTRFLALLTAVALTLAMVSCAAPGTTTKAPDTGKTEPTTDAAPSGQETDPAADPSGTHVITDHAGNEVTVKNTVNRVVVCDIYPLPSILAVFFDSAEKIVGMAPQSMAAARNSLLGQLYPEILNANTSFTDGTNVNTEELLLLQPDIVFYNAGNAALGEQIRNAGLTAVAISAGKWKYDALATLSGWIETFDQIFEANGKKDIVAAYGQKVYNEVQKRVSTLTDAQKKRVFFLFQYTDANMLTNGNPSFGSWWASAIGANNVVTGTTAANSLKTDTEQVYAWNPEVIFITNFTTAKAEDIYGNKIGTYDWSPVDAVVNERVYKMPLGMYRSYTAGVDAPIALYWLAKACYPALFEDIDITAETIAYYREVFGITLTAEQAASIFNPDVNAGKMN